MKSATTISKTPLILALRDSVSGKEVEIPRNAKGTPDFFVAGLALRRLHEPKAKALPASDKALKDSEARLRSSKKDYVKATKEYNAAVDAYEKAKTATSKARADKAKPGVLAKLEAAERKAKEKYQGSDAILCAYRKGFNHDLGAHEKLLKARHRAPAYDYATGSYRAFGRKSPGGYGAILLVAVPAKPKSTAATTPVKAAPIKPHHPSAVPSNSVTKKPESPKPVATGVTPAIPTATKTSIPLPPSKASEEKPATGTSSVPPSKSSPGLSKEHPLQYSQSEVKDGNILIHTTDGKIVKFPQATSKYQPHGGGLGSITTAEGQVYWFSYVAPVEDLGGDEAPKVSAKTETPTPPMAPKPPAAKLETPTAPKPEAPAISASSSSTNLSGISDAEAAEYTIPISGYPTTKAPVYLWKHKSQDTYLAVGSGKRVKLGSTQFLNLDKAAHPELYGKAPKPAPKTGAPKTTNEPDF